MLAITEPGLYKLVMRSNKPVAEKFQEWVCEDVLPSIRKKGEYVLEEYKQKIEEQQKVIEEDKKKSDEQQKVIEEEKKKSEDQQKVIEEKDEKIKKLKKSFHRHQSRKIYEEKNVVYIVTNDHNKR
jgi:prophage antirepressor-like protein